MAQRLLFPVLTSSIALLPGAAFAHVGHLGEVAGHSHWVGVAAIAGAAAVAGLVALKGRRKRARDAEDTPSETSADTEASKG